MRASYCSTEIHNKTEEKRLNFPERGGFVPTYLDFWFLNFIFPVS